MKVHGKDEFAFWLVMMIYYKLLGSCIPDKKKQLTLVKESCKDNKGTKNEARKANKCGVQTKMFIYGKNVHTSVYHIYVLSYKIMSSL